MKQPIASVADPDGQPLMDTLLGLEVASSEAYNTVQGTHNMAGKNVIAAMDSRFVETNAKFVETNAKFVETHAMIASIGAELRTLKWICGLSLALSGMLVTVVMGLVLYLLPGAPEPSNATVATAVAEELAPPGSSARDRSRRHLRGSCPKPLRGSRRRPLRGSCRTGCSAVGCRDGRDRPGVRQRGADNRNRRSDWRLGLGIEFRAASVARLRSAARC